MADNRQKNELKRKIHIKAWSQNGGGGMLFSLIVQSTQKTCKL